MKKLDDTTEGRLIFQGTQTELGEAFRRVRPGMAFILSAEKCKQVAKTLVKVSGEL